MSVVAAAVVGSAVVGAYSANKASKAQSKSATKGMEAEERIAYENRELQRELAEQQREDFAPWRDIGEKALEQIWSGVKSGAFEVGDIDVTKDPGYQFRMEQGIEALDKSASARGRLLSGAQQKGVTDYAQNVASQEYANAYAREANEKARKFNILSGLSSGGQASAAGQAQATGQLAQSEGNILANLGRSQNVTQQQIGAARAGAYQGTAQSVNQAAQNWLLYKNLGAA
jgi:hypothetical protein